MRLGAPEGLVGIAWFRLPTDADSRAWSLQTWRAVIAGELPAVRLSAGLVPAERSDLWTVTLSNDGPVDATLPRQVRLDPACETADGANGFRLAAASGPLVLEATGNGRLRANRKRIIGWARCTGPGEGARCRSIGSAWPPCWRRPASAAALACGPKFPWQLLDSREGTVKAPVELNFAFEASRLVGAPNDSLRAVESDRPVDDEAVTAEREEIQSGAWRGLMPAATDDWLLARLEAARGADTGEAARAAAAGLPVAVADYLAGAAEYHADRLDAAMAFFQAIDRLPAEQRKFAPSRRPTCRAASISAWGNSRRRALLSRPRAGMPRRARLIPWALRLQALARRRVWI